MPSPSINSRIDPPAKTSVARLKEWSHTPQAGRIGLVALGLAGFATVAFCLSQLSADANQATATLNSKLDSAYQNKISLTCQADTHPGDQRYIAGQLSRLITSFDCKDPEQRAKYDIAAAFISRAHPDLYKRKHREQHQANSEL